MLPPPPIMLLPLDADHAAYTSLLPFFPLSAALMRTLFTCFKCGNTFSRKRNSELNPVTSLSSMPPKCHSCRGSSGWYCTLRLCKSDMRDRCLLGHNTGGFSGSHTPSYASRSRELIPPFPALFSVQLVVLVARRSSLASSGSDAEGVGEPGRHPRHSPPVSCSESNVGRTPDTPSYLFHPPTDMVFATEASSASTMSS